MVGSGTADWYVPLVVLGAPPIVVGAIAALAQPQADPGTDSWPPS
jgi:hypothetical protein